MTISMHTTRDNGSHEAATRAGLNLQHGPLRTLARLPLWLYRAHLGWLLGQRFLRLTHTGRRTGMPRQTVLEVVAHDRQTDTYVVVSGLGERSQWLRNIQRTPEVAITVGRRQIQARAERLGEDDAARLLRDYQRRHPLAFRVIARLLGWHVGDTATDAHLLARRFPLVALRPRR